MVIATGFFDGVHLGHRLVLKKLVEIAKSRGEESMAVTFWPHPRTVLQNDARDFRLLTSVDEKTELIKSCGVDHVEVLTFTKEFTLVSTKQYLQEYIMDKFGGTAILLGYDNKMGNDVKTPDEIQEIAESIGLDVFRTDKIELSGITVSSTKIRTLLLEGKVETASQMLSYNYTLHGVVVAGNQIGRTIGFPTANMQLYEPLKLVPSNGVYFVSVETIGKKLYGMCSIGVRPTIGNGNHRTIEINIFDFDEDIYGLDISISFLAWIRPEEKFDSIKALIDEIENDKRFCLSRIPKV